jgi:signal transduction histidine kinase
MSAGAFRDALGETSDRYDVLLSHLSVIRDLADVAQHTTSLEGLCGTLAARIVASLNYERASVMIVRDGGEPAVVGSASQAERLGGTSSEVSPILRVLAGDVMSARRLLRWSDEGVGARRPVPAGLDGSVVGWPLVVGGECIGAIVCEEVVSTPWDLARQRALELVGEIIDQVVTLTEVRLSMASIQRHLEAELGMSRSLLSDREETLRAQSDRIGNLTGALVTSNQAKNHFLGLMSHELRTPLSVILGFGSILYDGLAGPVTPEQEGHLGRVLSNGRHLSQLIDDMLFFVDAETTRIVPRWEPVDLPALVTEVAQALPEAAKPDAPALSVTIAPAAAVLRSDTALLRRLLFHLMANAFKFTEHGSVTVEAGRGADGSTVEIRIIDSGIGIPAEHLRKIFDLFQQGDDTHARKREGIGLGLNLVHACLVLLHGRCRLVARPAGGTCVELSIPDVAVARVPHVPDPLTHAAELAAGEAALIGVAHDGAEVAAVARRAMVGLGSRPASSPASPEPKRAS